MRYQGPDVAFDVPRGWDDRTVVAFAMPPQKGQTTSNVVMTRDALGQNETIAQYADKQFAELAKRLDGFNLVHRREVSVSGHAGVELRFGWLGSQGPLEQRLIMVATKKRAVLSFTATCPKAESAQLQPVFDRIFASVSLLDPGP